MTIKQNLIEPFNAQIRSEFTASAQYIAIAAYFDEIGLNELAQFFFRQSDEERMHAMKFVTYLQDRGVRVKLGAIAAPSKKFDSPRDAFAKALELEEANTVHINKLYKLSLDVTDFATQSFMTWFVDEQVEEERSRKV